MKCHRKYNADEKLYKADYSSNSLARVSYITCSGNKKAIKQFKKILRELYVYYGVSEKDIAEKTERYLCLLSVLSS